MRKELIRKRIPVSGPWITKKEADYVARAAKEAWYDNANMYHQKFEKAFADYIGAKYAMCLPSCTSAIHLSLLALGIGKGDEVIVPDITWIASAAPVTYVGATPVFADIDERTWCLSAESVENLVTSKTKAIISVDLYGGMPDMDALRNIAKKNKIAIIEDAAQAIGSEYKARRAGSLGDTGVFSFHGAKTLTTGEGGMLVTDNRKVYDRCLILRDHGRTPGDPLFFNREIAFKYKMSSLQAAFGLAQLERIEELLAKKLQIFLWYKDNLNGVSGITINYEPPGVKNTFWMPTIILNSSMGIQKTEFMRRMAERDIDCRPFFYPLSSLPAYGKLKQAASARKRNSVSYRLSPYGVNLPSALSIDKSSVKQVCEVLKSILYGSRY